MPAELIHNLTIMLVDALATITSELGRHIERGMQDGVRWALSPVDIDLHRDGAGDYRLTARCSALACVDPDHFEQLRAAQRRDTTRIYSEREAHASVGLFHPRPHDG